jgi:hypothetical protein
MDTLLSRLSVFHVKQAYYKELKEMGGNEDRIRRVNRGFDILVAAAEYTITLKGSRPLTFKVSGPNGDYTVIESERLCTCPDGQTLCKHRFAIRIMLQAIKAMKEDKLSITIGEKKHE